MVEYCVMGTKFYQALLVAAALYILVCDICDCDLWRARSGQPRTGKRGDFTGHRCP